MNGPARLAVVVLLLSAVSDAHAQTMLQPASEPIVTAERTEWYLAGEPITYDGNIYYLVGAPVHFSRYEMVRSGSYRGVPLYVRTTFEPYSIVFVPLSGGVMQPYERRRGGDIAGTVGTTTPGLPVVVATRSEAPDGLIPQAAAPPVVTDTRVPPEHEPAPAAAPTPAAPATTGTSGRVERPAPPMPYEPLIKPRGLDAAYVEFNGQRWFPKGNAVSLEGMRLVQVGVHHGFPVYAAGSAAATIYIPVTRDAAALATPFSRRR